MSVDFAPHGGGKSLLLDGILAVQPASRTISCFTLTTIATRSRSFFHPLGNIITDCHLRQIEHLPVLISHSRTHRGTACIHPKGQWLRIGVLWRSMQLDRKGCSACHFGFSL